MLSDDSFFRAVEQMNLGIDLITVERERIELASLNLEAGIKARKRAAFNSALSYLNIALNLLPDKSWIEYYDLTSSVIRELAEAEYIDGNYERSEIL
jgi:predicted ATPase